MKRSPLKRKTPLKKKRTTPRRKAKTKSKTPRQLRNELKQVFNRYIRRRDTYPSGWGRCCTCGNLKRFENLQAGHYIHNCSPLRYDERNVHAQCVSCNCFSGGQATRYAAFLVKRYGPDIILYFDDKRKEKKRWGKAELEELIAHYRGKLRELGD